MGNKNKHRQSGFETSCENAPNENVNSGQEVEQQEVEQQEAGTPTAKAAKYKVAAGCSLTSKRGILSPGAAVENLDEIVIKSLYERKLIVKA